MNPTPHPTAPTMDSLDGSRKLIRILVEIMPNSRVILEEEIDREMKHQAVVLSGSGGKCTSSNKVTPGVIVRFLSRAIGDMPEAPWGVPTGWGSYVALLMALVLNKPVSVQQAVECVNWTENGSCEAVSAKLTGMGLFPHCWKHPLILEEVRKDNAKGQTELRQMILVVWGVVLLAIGFLMSFLMS